ncbi:hypothetical protein AB0L74_19480 [Streptomyces sp. NPDC052020]|uniref:nSTAND1 domain-containing NTPase n=1 Tax=Streptomyces sp. NPDC052020 TaxID=3155677 RepID=UPI00342BC7B2
MRSEAAAVGTAAMGSRWAKRPGKRVLLHPDQFEELLTGTPAAEPATLVAGLIPAVRAPSAPLCLVATPRADLLPLLLALPGVGRRLHDRILALSAMSAAALERAITGRPAPRGDVRTGPGRADRGRAGGGPEQPDAGILIDAPAPALFACWLVFAATSGSVASVTGTAAGASPAMEEWQ